MLNFRQLASHEDRQAILDSFDPLNTTWILADLDHKNFIQDQLLQKFSWLPEDACLRATEVWTKLLKRSEPTYRIVSPVFMEAYAARWLGKKQGAKTLLAYVELFLPILI